MGGTPSPRSACAQLIPVLRRSSVRSPAPMTEEIKNGARELVGARSTQESATGTWNERSAYLLQPVLPLQ